LRCCAGAYNPKSGRNKNAEYNRALSLLGRQACRGKANDDGVVCSQHQVDHDDLNQGRDCGAGDDIGHDASLRAGSMSQPIWSMVFDPIQRSGPERS
jgi:hypothetical protein